jgi:hypothetical protein
VVAGHPAEDPVVGQPELGHDIERDQAADQLVGQLGELGGQVGGRGGIGDLGGTRRRPDDPYFTLPGVSSDEHAGMVDLGADGDPRNR